MLRDDSQKLYETTTTTSSEREKAKKKKKAVNQPGRRWTAARSFSATDDASVEIDETKTGALLPRRPRGRRRRINRDDKTTDFIVLIAMDDDDRSPPPFLRIPIVFFSFFFFASRRQPLHISISRPALSFPPAQSAFALLPTYLPSSLPTFRYLPSREPTYNPITCLLIILIKNAQFRTNE